MRFGQIIYMKISIIDPLNQTILFGLLFIITLIASIKRSKDKHLFSQSKTEELKGFAILAVIFSHISYFLSADNRFLFPLSILAGVGVDLFLFLSGFGLTSSALKSPLSIVNFYKKRLKKLFLPMWLVIFLFIILDFFILHTTYSQTEIVQSFVGFFPQANLYLNIDSPLWYFSIIFFYYLIFPLFFWNGRLKYLSPLIIGLVSYLFLHLPLHVSSSVWYLYKLHYLAFPLGILFSLLINDQTLSSLRYQFKKIFVHNKFKYIFVTLFTFIFAYTAINSGVGQDKSIQQLISLITCFSIIYIFVVIDFEFKIFNMFGKLSYEIYLIHWPLLYRYGLPYQLFPAYLSTYFYLAIFLSLGYCIQKMFYSSTKSRQKQRSGVD